MNRKPFLLLLLPTALSLGTGLARANDYAQAVASYRAGNYAKAAAVLNKVVLSQPGNAEAAYYQALCAQQLGHFDEARTLYRKVSKKFPDQAAGQLSMQALQQLDGAGRQSIYPRSQARRSAQPAGGDVLPEDARIPFRRLGGGHMLVKGAVNGRSIDMLFDTGASICAFGANNLAAIGVTPPSGKPTRIMQGVGGMVAVREMEVEISLGPIRRHVPIVVSDNLEQPLLGQTFFSDFAYDIDTAGGFIRLTKKSGGPGGGTQRADLYPADAVAVPFRREGNQIVVEAKVNGQPYSMYFDTGASGTVFSFGDLQSLGISVPPDAQGIMGRGVGGGTPGYLMKIDRLELGPVLKSNLSVQVLAQTARRPLLGQSFFGDKRFTIDNDNKVIRFWH